MKTPRERYHTDSHFYHLVNVLYNCIEKAQFAPTEIREAAMLAQIKYEEKHPRPLMCHEYEPARRKK